MSGGQASEELDHLGPEPGSATQQHRVGQHRPAVFPERLAQGSASSHDFEDHDNKAMMMTGLKLLRLDFKVPFMKF